MNYKTPTNYPGYIPSNGSASADIVEFNSTVSNHITVTQSLVLIALSVREEITFNLSDKVGFQVGNEANDSQVVLSCDLTFNISGVASVSLVPPTIMINADVAFNFLGTNPQNSSISPLVSSSINNPMGVTTTLTKAPNIYLNSNYAAYSNVCLQKGAKNIFRFTGARKQFNIISKFMCSVDTSNGSKNDIIPTVYTTICPS